MQAGAALSASLSRQMEFDADRYSARVVGARVTAATLSEIPRLDAAAQAAWAEVNWHLSGALGAGRFHVPSCGGRCWQLGEFVAIPARTAGASES